MRIAVIASVVEQVIRQFQFIALLATLDVDWPDQFREFLDVFSIFNLDPQELVGDQEIPLIDFRILFIIISILVPIFITLMVLLLYVAVTSVVWYAVVCSGIVILVAGLFGRYLPSVGTSDTESVADAYIVIGAALAGGALLIGYVIHKYHKDEEVPFDQMKAELSKFHRVRSLLHFSVSICLILAGLILLGVVDFDVSALNNSGSSITGILSVLAYCMICLGGIIFIYFIINLFGAGRRGTFAAATWLKNNGLMVLLLIISSSFIPAMSYSLTMVMCKTYTCPLGTRFNPHAERPIGNFDTSESRYCDPCVFLNTECAGSVPNVTQLCPAAEYVRNWKNPDIPCDDEAAGFFIFAACIVLVVYAVCIPLLYFKIVRFLTMKLSSDVRYTNMEEDDSRTVWQTRLILMRPTAATLYEPFIYQFRYYSLVTLGHRALVMSALVIFAPFYPNAAIPLILVFHAISFGLILYFKPFNLAVEQGLAIGLAICNTANAIFALYLWEQGGGGSSTTTGIFIFLNVIIPAVISLAMALYVKQNREKLLEQQQAEKEAREQEHEGLEKIDISKMNKKQREELKRKRLLAATKIREARKAAKTLILPPECETEDSLRSELNKEVGEKQMARFFMVMGVFFFIALGACVLGTLRQENPEYRIASNSFTRDKFYTLGGFNSWEEVTDNCCCLNSRNPSVNFNLTERWVCNSKVVIEKGRVSDNLEHNGLVVRGTCNSVHNFQCSVLVDDDRPELSCPLKVKEGLLDSGNMSAKAYRLYW